MSIEEFEPEKCVICDKLIDEQHDDYEIVETYLAGDFEDATYMHTECRYKEDKKNKNETR